MRSARIAAVAITIVLGVCGGLFAAHVTDGSGDDTKGCEGLGDYRAAMFKAGRDYLKALDDDRIPVSRDITTFSSDDFVVLADDALDYSRVMKGIIPPSFAATWHQVKIERLGIVEQIGRAAAQGGLFVALAFSDQIDANERAAADAVAAAAAICADFASFEHDWQALDGLIDGTPVATPTD